MKNVDLHARFEEGRFVIPVAIAGRTFFFLLDSGASAITIDPRVAKQLGLPLLNESHEIAGKRFESHDTIIPALDVGGLQMHDVVASSVSLGMGNKPADPVGLLGFDFLAGLAVRIDYEHKRVIAMDPRSYVPPAGKDVSAVDVRLGSQVPMISAKLAGTVAERLIVDTGSGGSLLLFGYFARRHGDVLRSRLDFASSSGIGGAFASRAYRLHSVQIGNFSMTDLVADVVTSADAYPQDNDGLIGSDILQFFTVDLDYAAGRIFLRARPQLLKLVS